MATQKTLPIPATAGLRVEQFDLQLPVAIFVGLSTYTVANGVVFLLRGLVCRLLSVVLA
ncbi:hypothetical protein [Mesorhizobium sp. KR9-304]|uniref:hypothetical protein n=1 Tax=Mesorhizobium sp. KR9-304 TaxID=3156614 RepID=UPI0032B5B706